MLDRFFKTSAWGLQKERSAVISSIRGEISIEQLFTTPADVKPLDMGQYKDCHLVSTLEASELLARPLEIKLTKRKDIEAVLAFQAEPLLPYPTDEAILDFQELSDAKGASQLTLLAVRKEALKNHLDQLKAHQLEPERVLASPLALAIFAKHATDLSDDEPLLIIHIDDEETICVLAKQGKLIGCFTLPKGILSIIQAIKYDLNVEEHEARINLETLPPQEGMYPAFFKAVQDLKQEIARMVFALAKQNRIQRVADVLLTGPGAWPSWMGPLLSDVLKTPISIPIERFGQSSRSLQEYAIAIGLALSEAQKDPVQVNFRKVEYAYPDPWKRIKAPLIAYLILSVSLMFCLILLGKAWSFNRLDRIKEDYADFLRIWGSPYEKFEKDFGAKSDGQPPSESLASLSATEIEKRLSFIQQQIQNAPETFPLYPNVPRVSDILAWLAKHPKAVKELGKPLLNITMFNYSLIKRPDNKKPNEKYQAKVEFEFTTDSPTWAREFHDALIEPNEMIDPKGEVKWNQSGDVYRTSFFLKNKPPKIAMTEEAHVR